MRKLFPLFLILFLVISLAECVNQIALNDYLQHKMYRTILVYMNNYLSLTVISWSCFVFSYEVLMKLTAKYSASSKRTEYLIVLLIFVICIALPKTQLLNLLWGSTVGAALISLAITFFLLRKLFTLQRTLLRKIQLACLVFLLLLNVSIILDHTFRAKKPVNLVWIVIDALRADHLGIYGYSRNTSPGIDALAADSSVFLNAFSQESYTRPSVASFFTSTYPWTHQTLYGQPKANVLPLKLVTIAEILREQGYLNLGIVYNPNLIKEYNFAQGFDYYDDNPEGWDHSLPPEQTFETAKKIHSKLESILAYSYHRPAFIYLHYFDVHAPYVAPEPYNHIFSKEPNPISKDPLFPYLKPEAQSYIDAYDAEIRYTDEQISQILPLLKKHNINRKNSIIIISSDHGEEFFDQHPQDPGGRYHGRTLFREQIHVPLIISLPFEDNISKKISTATQLIDIVPTILDYLGISGEYKAQLQGSSMLSELLGRSSSKVSHQSKVVLSGGSDGRGTLLYDGWKYHKHSKRIKETSPYNLFDYQPSLNSESFYSEEIYQTSIDEDERLEQSTKAPDLQQQLKAMFEDHLSASSKRLSSPETIENDLERIKQLISLGYM